MIIKSCYVENFGALHQQTFDLKDGLNIFIEENGWGKSTLAAFIKNMLFGMEYSTKRKEVNDRVHYMPWNGAGYGGSIIFEAMGKEYRAERTFGKKDTEDTFTLYNNVTGMRTDDLPSDMGSRIFGIDMDSFERSTYVRLDGKAPEMQDNISAKLNDLINDTDDVNNYESACRKLDAVSVSIKAKRGDGGKTGDNLKKITALKIKLTACRDAQARAAALKQKAEEINAGLKNDGSHMQQLEDSLDAAKLKEMREKPSESDTAELSSLKEKYGNDAPDEGEFRSYMQRYNESLKLQGRLETEERSLEMLENLPEPAQREIHGMGRTAAAISVLTVAAVIIAASLFILRSPMSWIVSAVTAAAAVFVISVIMAKIRKREEAAEEDMRQRKKAEKALNDQRMTVEQLKQQLESSRKAYTDFITQYDGFADMNNVPGVLAEMNSEVQRMKYLSAQAEGYDRNMINEISAAAERLKALKTEIAGKQELLLKYRSQYEDLLTEADKEEDTENEISELVRQNEELMSRYELVVQTIGLLTEARSSLSLRYMDVIRSSFDKYFSKLGSSDRKVTLNADLGSMVEKNGKQWKSDYYSSGSRDLVNICTRLALIDAMFSGEKPFIILDDPFSNLDDEKLGRALEFLDKLAGGRQVLYFTCSGYRGRIK